MQYKIIVYEKTFIEVETKRGISKKPYFKKVHTEHNIHKAILSKTMLELQRKYIGYHMEFLSENESESTTIASMYNEKIKKYINMGVVTA